ncbi:MAG TPA: TetR/AcrR family transcriptional regulator [Saprospiraceae bacterium]|nr:TetR/AcrR family transcriptional regulator [Saprospiraceae bacterium]
MKEEKRLSKEESIITAAEKVFNKVGYKNAKMEEVAKAAGITKVTLYTYFQSKENLYMALTYRGFQKLLNGYYQVIDKFKNKSGLISSLALLDKFMDFSTENFVYNDALLNYFSTIRSADEKKLTDAIKESIYFTKMQDIHNLIFKLSAKEILRGKKDGSIINKLDPMFLSLHAWTMVIGYSKLLASSGNKDVTIFHMKMSELKQLILQTAKIVLTNDIKLEENILEIEE